MSGFVGANLSTSHQVATIADLLIRWEPRLELIIGDDECRIFEPDGTLYVICLSDETNLTVRHKSNRLRRGDAFIVPASVSIDVDPPFRYLAIRHDGTPPNHFRERFIQTWGVDPRPAVAPNSSSEASIILPDQPLRYRFTYQAQKLVDQNLTNKTEWQAHLILSIEGRMIVETQGMPPIELPSDELLWIPPGSEYTINGSGAVGSLYIDTELVYENKRLAILTGPNQRISPEFVPGVLPEPNN